MMALNIIDYNLPVTMEVLGASRTEKKVQLIKVAIEWHTIKCIQEEVFLPDLIATFGPLTQVITITDSYLVPGYVEEYIRAWTGYKLFVKKEREKMRFNFTIN